MALLCDVMRTLPSQHTFKVKVRLVLLLHHGHLRHVARLHPDSGCS